MNKLEAYFRNETEEWEEYEGWFVNMTLMMMVRQHIGHESVEECYELRVPERVLRSYYCLTTVVLLSY